MDSDADSPEVVWQPATDQVANTRIAHFRRWLWENRALEVADYDELWTCSTTELAEFWSAVAEYLAMHWHERPEEVLSGTEMPGTRWFTGATLNYAEHALGRGIAGAAKA